MFSTAEDKPGDSYMALQCRQIVRRVRCLGLDGVLVGVAFVFGIVRPATPRGRWGHVKHDFHTTAMEAWCS